MIIEINAIDEWGEHRLKALAAHNRNICFTGKTGFKWCRIELEEADSFVCRNNNLIIELCDNFKCSVNMSHLEDLIIR